MKVNAVPIIKERLTMREVLERYGYEAKKRIPCPIHSGKHANFEVKEKTFCCHSHCGSGDVITFVRKLFGLSFPDALKKIDADFGIGIYRDHTSEENRRYYYMQMAANAKRERERQEREKAETDYWEAFDEWKRLDDNMRIYRPKSPDEDFHPLFVESLQKLSYQEYVLDCLTYGG